MQQAINFTEVEPVDQRKTLAYKLSDASSHIQKLEITMAILEAKISSIPGLEAYDGAPPANNVQNNNNAAPANNAAPTDNNADNDAEEEEAAPVAAPGVVLNKDEPKYQPYFKLLRLGVPTPQIKMKMTNDGFDPNAIDNPDEPSALGGDDDEFGEKSEYSSEESESWED